LYTKVGWLPVLEAVKDLPQVVMKMPRNVLFLRRVRKTCGLDGLRGQFHT